MFTKGKAPWVLYLAIIVSFTIFIFARSICFIRSQYRAGLSKELCKCENPKIFKHNAYKVINGTRLANGLPWAAFIFLRNQTDSNNTNVKRPFCTCTIINRYFAIAAAHCSDVSNQIAFVGAGLDHDFNPILNTKANFKKVKTFHNLPADEQPDEQPVLSMQTYDRRKLDLTLVELEEPFEFNAETNVSPACLLDFKKDDFPNEFLAAGYGRTKSRNHTFENIEPVIAEVTTKVVTTKTVEQILDDSNKEEPVVFMTANFRLANLSEYYFAMNSSHSNLCRGDSGGPLHYEIDERLYVVGEASFMHNALRFNDTHYTVYQCYPGLLVYYINIYSHLNWIKRSIHSEMCLTSTHFEVYKDDLLWLLLSILIALIAISAFSIYFLFGRSSDNTPVSESIKRTSKSRDHTSRSNRTPELRNNRCLK